MKNKNRILIWGCFGIIVCLVLPFSFALLTKIIVGFVSGILAGWIINSNEIGEQKFSVNKIRLNHPFKLTDFKNLAVGSEILYESKTLKQAAIGINAKMLNHHKQAIYAKTVQRNSKIRDSENVRGRHRQKKFVDAQGKPHYLWHRTHLVPFRYCLDESKLQTVWAYSHVNVGSRPQLNIDLDMQDIDNDHDYVMRLIESSNGNLEYNPARPNYPNGTHLSLADYEQAADHYISYYKEDNFVYTVTANFDKFDNLKSATSQLYDKTKNRFIFKVQLDNVK